MRGTWPELPERALNIICILLKFLHTFAWNPPIVTWHDMTANVLHCLWGWKGTCSIWSEPEWAPHKRCINVWNIWWWAIHVCDQIWENPAYCQNVQMAHCTFFVLWVKNCHSSSFVVSMSKKISSNCSHHLRWLNTRYKGEISLCLQGVRSTSCRAQRAIIKILTRGLSRYS